jgi:hypothetical protein
MHQEFDKISTPSHLINRHQSYHSGSSGNILMEPNSQTEPVEMEIMIDDVSPGKTNKYEDDNKDLA